jgi:hypothetical protein
VEGDVVLDDTGSWGESSPDYEVTEVVVDSVAAAAAGEALPFLLRLAVGAALLPHGGPALASCSGADGATARDTALDT